MTLQDAIDQMKVGNKVKLPEWEGYWFIPNGLQEKDDRLNVRVFTKTGDILETPWFDKYDRRDDFEIADGKLGFDFVLRALRSGKKVKRFHWLSGQYIFLVLAKEYQIEKSLNNPPLKMDFIARVFLTGQENEMFAAPDISIEPYIPSQRDMLAKDWVIMYQEKILRL